MAHHAASSGRLSLVTGGEVLYSRNPTVPGVPTHLEQYYAAQTPDGFHTSVEDVHSLEYQQRLMQQFQSTHDHGGNHPNLAVNDGSWTGPFDYPPAAPQTSMNTPLLNAHNWQSGPHRCLSAVSDTELTSRWQHSPSASILGQHAYTDPEGIASPIVKIEEPDWVWSEHVPLTAGPAAVNPQDLSSHDANAMRTLQSLHFGCKMEENSWEDSVDSPTSFRRIKSSPTEHDGFLLDDGRRKRNFTTEETAKCRCGVCGKLFQRSYNLKAHLDTHNPEREHPFECDFQDCDQRFVRKTDLTRHVSSVHLRLKSYGCVKCMALFARKDTLRRHVYDGCPLRPAMRNMSRTTSSPNDRSDRMVLMGPG